MSEGKMKDSGIGRKLLEEENIQGAVRGTVFGSSSIFDEEKVKGSVINLDRTDSSARVKSLTDSQIKFGVLVSRLYQLSTAFKLDNNKRERIFSVVEFIGVLTGVFKGIQKEVLLELGLPHDVNTSSFSNYSKIDNMIGAWTCDVAEALILQYVIESEWLESRKLIRDAIILTFLSYDDSDKVLELIDGHTIKQLLTDIVGEEINNVFAEELVKFICTKLESKISDTVGEDLKLRLDGSVLSKIINKE